MARNLLRMIGMPQPQRLSALDATFLALSTPEVPFVPGCVLVLDHPIERAALEGRIDALLTALPRYRQRIARAPLVHSLAWIDDDEFSLDRHVGVVSLPAPGGQRELEACVAKLLTAGVPQDHAPWRLWLVDGLADGGGALVAVVHHALVDGVAGMALLEQLLRLAPEPAPSSAQSNAAPREREPRPNKLARIVERVAADLRGRAAAWRHLRSEFDPRRQAPKLAELLWQGMQPASDLGFDGHAITGARNFAMFTVPLDEAKAIKRAFDVTVNDVMLGCISGALRRFVARRGIDPDQLDDVRAFVPVNRHSRDEHATSGNRVALLLTPLAVDEGDAMACLRRIAATTRVLKQRDMAGAGDLLTAVSDLTWSGVLTNVFRVALWRRAFNLIVTNVPGPPVPLYLLDARVTRLAPIVNLWPHIPLAIAIGSYAGTLTLTIDADPATVPDPAAFVEDLAASFGELRAAIAVRAVGRTSATGENPNNRAGLG